MGGCILTINCSDEPVVCSAKSGNSEAKCPTVIMGKDKEISGDKIYLFLKGKLAR